MHLTWGFLKFQLGNQVRENIKITQIQPRFALKFKINFKFGNDMNLNWGFLKFQLGNRFGEKIKITQICFETFN